MRPEIYAQTRKIEKDELVTCEECGRQINPRDEAVMHAPDDPRLYHLGCYHRLAQKRLEMHQPGHYGDRRRKRPIHYE